MSVEKLSFSLSRWVAHTLAEAAAKFGIPKSQVVNETLKRCLPALLRADSFEIEATVRVADD